MIRVRVARHLDDARPQARPVRCDLPHLRQRHAEIRLRRRRQHEVAVAVFGQVQHAERIADLSELVVEHRGAAVGSEAHDEVALAGAAAAADQHAAVGQHAQVVGTHRWQARGPAPLREFPALCIATQDDEVAAILRAHVQHAIGVRGDRGGLLAFVVHERDAAPRARVHRLAAGRVVDAREHLE